LRNHEVLVNWTKENISKDKSRESDIEEIILHDDNFSKINNNNNQKDLENNQIKKKRIRIENLKNGLMNNQVNDLDNNIQNWNLQYIVNLR
jgi:hypothetical protein